MYTDERINYTDHMRWKPQETDPAKLATMKNALVKALKDRGVHGHISATYYTDGNILVRLNGEFYGVFDCRKGEFFSGYVGDQE